MKKLLVLTDLSENAKSAAIAAVSISGKLGAQIILVNAYVPTPVLPMYGDTSLITAGGYTLWEDDVQERLNELKHKLQDLVEEHAWTGTVHQIQAKAMVGDLSTALKELPDKEKIIMIIIGSSDEGALDHLIFGSDTNTVLQHAVQPVMIVPPEAQLEKINKITFATAYDPNEFEAIRSLLTLARSYEAELEIVHVAPLDQAETRSNAEIADFIKHLQRFEYPNIVHRNIRGLEITDRLLRHCKEGHTALLVMVHHRYTQFKTLFQGSKTKKVLKEQAVPMIIYPANHSTTHHEQA